MVWTIFYTQYPSFVSQSHSLFHNPVLINLPLSKASIVFEDKYGENIIRDCHYYVRQYNEIEHATAYFRGCIMTDMGFLEESRADSSFKYLTNSQYLKLPSVLVIKNHDAFKADGSQCSNCKEFVLWAAPNQASGVFLCRACILDPWR